MASVWKHADLLMVFIYFLCCYVALTGASTVTAPDMENPPLIDFGEEHGDTKVKDLMADEEVELPTNISYFGSQYNKLYISTDGLISFESGMKYVKTISWEEGVRNENMDKPFLATFLYDGLKPANIPDELYEGGVYYRVVTEENLQKSTKYENEELIKWLGQYVPETTLDMDEGFEADVVVVVTWDKVASLAADLDELRACKSDQSQCKDATFQVVLVSDTTLGRTVAFMNYLKNKITMKPSYQAGFNGGYGRGWHNVIPCHGRCSSLKLDNNVKTYLDILPDLQGSDVVGRFILEVGGENVVRGGCLPAQFESGILEVYPRQVSMLGGEKLEVSVLCRPVNSEIFCRFGESEDSPVVQGNMVNSMKGICPVPPLTTKGNIFVQWATEKDEEDWAFDRTISVIHPSRVEPPVSVPKDVMEAWYSRDASEITVVWDPKKFAQNQALADVKLIGYRETSDTVEYKELETLGRDVSVEKGKFTFRVADHRCKQDCTKFELGLLEVALKPEYLGVAKERVAVRQGPIPLGWYVNEKMTEDNGSDWSNKMCKAWHAEDSKQSDWLDSLLPCPCTLDQALADFGRFQPDAGCNMFTGSKCTYHKQAKHCVRAVVPTEDGAGNQCCYGETGQLVYSQLSYQGSTPDRSHDWGAAPYKRPDLVPAFSHWKHDVLTFYYCCLWNEYELCDLYMERRPTQDCKHYDVPAVATLRGVPHVSTFDGQNYQIFGGVGDFILLSSEMLVVQGRFGARRGAWDLGKLSGGDSWSAPVLKAVGIKYGAVIVDFQLAPENSNPQRGLDIYVKEKSNERRFFNTRSTMWQDFNGLSIVNNALPGEVNKHNNFTVLTTNNAGVNVIAENGLIQVTVVLPPEMKKTDDERTGMGLLGTYDGNSANDFMTQSGMIVSPGTSAEKFSEDFIFNWVVEKRDCTFAFFKKATLSKDDPFYSDYDEIPSDFDEAPTDTEIAEVCGEEDSNCKWDYRITGSPKVAETTKGADELFSYVQASLKEVDSCGLPGVGRNAILDSYDFSVGSKITVTGCGEGMDFSGSEEYECVTEPLSDAEKEDRDDYGLVKTDKESGSKYITHWLPKPTVLCTPGSASGGLDLMWIIIIAVAAVVLLTIIVIIIIVVLRRRRNSDKYSSHSRPKPANRRSGGDNRDERSGEAMLSREDNRRPVYKPSKEPLQMQGSTV